MASRFTAVDPEAALQAPEHSGPSPAAIAAQQQAATQMLGLALRSLSQRAVVAISNLFTAAALFSAWWLWDNILPEPTTLQLVGVGLYAVFILMLEIVRRR